MPQGFEIGSIFARLKIENEAAIKALKDAGKKAVDWGKGVEKVAKTTTKKFNDHLRKIGKGIKIRLGIDPKKEITAFNLIGAAGKKAGLAIRKAFRGVRSVFARLRRAAFSLQGVLLQVGVALSASALIERAKDVEQVRLAFDNLTASIGGTSSAFLVGLRKATRGAVSDLELMRVANNAILLGVTKNQDQFVELARIARRLGQALGRTATESINDLALGIGRRSRKILDNLGLIVKVGEANENYARSLGKLAKDLSIAEQNQAFLNATLDAGREKLDGMGKDVYTVGQAWGKFTSAISNTVNVIAEAFVGRGVFTVVADWLDESRSKIASYSRFVKRVVVELITNIATAMSLLFGDGFGGLVDRVSKQLIELMKFFSTIVIESVSALFGKLFVLIPKLIAQVIVQVLVSVADEIAHAYNDLSGDMEKKATKLLAKIPVITQLLGLDDPDAVKDALGEIDKSVARTAGRIKQNAARLRGFLTGMTNSTVSEIADEIDTIGTKVVATMTARAAAGDSYATYWTNQVNTVRRALGVLDFDLASTAASMKNLSVSLPLQGIANDLNALAGVHREAIQLAGEYGDEILSVADVEAQSRAITNLRGDVEDLNKLFQSLSEAPEGARGDLYQEFARTFEDITTKLKEASKAQTLFVTGVTLGPVGMSFSGSPMRSARCRRSTRR